MKSTSLLQTLPQLMVELIVIVVGILLALWVDSYWEERKDRQAEHAALLSIHEEFVENQQRLIRAVDHHTEILDSTNQVFDSTPPDCNEELEATLQLVVFAWHTFNPVTGATESLISSG